MCHPYIMCLDDTDTSHVLCDTVRAGRPPTGVNNARARTATEKNNSRRRCVSNTTTVYQYVCVCVSQQNSDEQINFSVWLLFWYSVLFSGSSGSQTKALINNTKKSKREVPERTGRTEAKKWGDKRDTGKQKGQKKRQKNGECEDRGKDAGRAEVRRESLLSSWMVLCTVQSIQASPPSSPHHLCLLFSSMKHDPS